jgi:heptosyltransferase-3
MGSRRLAESLGLIAAPRPQITVVRAGGLGDTVLLLPCLQMLHAELPDARLTLVGSAWGEALRPLVPFPLHTARFDSPRLAPLFAAPATEDSSGIFSASDGVILYTEDPSSHFVRNAMRHCRGPVIVWPATTIRNIHAAAHYARAIARHPIDVRDLPRPELRPPPDRGPWARNWLDARFGTGVRPMAVHPGSGGRRKCWPPPQFADLIGRLGIPTTLIEGPADREPCEEVAARLHATPPLARAAGLPLPSLAALLHECCLYVGNDSGVSHLAAALGTPTVAVVGPTDPVVWGPLGRRVTAIQPGPGTAWPTTEAVLAAIEQLRLESPQHRG